MQLQALLSHVDVVETSGSLDRTVTAVTRDSRQANAETVFVAIVGAKVDGHDHVAMVPGAVIVVERSVEAPAGSTVVRVPASKVALAQIAAALHGFPGKALPIVGITGTNGKTTVATLVDLALVHLGWRTARVGTHAVVIDGEVRPTAFTTPEAPALQALLAEARSAGVQAVVMEVTSIGLAQHRVDGIAFDVGVFTNLTRDHLDFHGTFAAYREAKGRLFGELLRPTGNGVRAIVCGDDPAWCEIGAPPDTWRYGTASDHEIRLTDVVLDMHGISATLVTPDGDLPLRSPLVGHHNALNLAATWGVLRALGLDPDAAIEAVGAVGGVPGRLERVGDPSGGRLILVDYAHSEDALHHVLSTTQGLGDGDLWVVFGCGGDRDRGKRPRMGAVAGALADHVVLTSDNPRSEDPQSIVDAIAAGMAPQAPRRVDLDRAEAIRWTLEQARSGDTIVIAGKGHETTQEIAGEKFPFDDRQVVRAALEDR